MVKAIGLLVITSFRYVVIGTFTYHLDSYLPLDFWFLGWWLINNNIIERLNNTIGYVMFDT